LRGHFVVREKEGKKKGQVKKEDKGQKEWEKNIPQINFWLRRVWPSQQLST